MDKTHEKYAIKPGTDLRKKEFQVTDEIWTKKILTHDSHGTLALTYNHKHFINHLINFYEAKENWLYFHGAWTERLRANLYFNPNIAFNILAHKGAHKFNVAFNSLTILRTARIVYNEIKTKKS